MINVNRVYKKHNKTKENYFYKIKLTFENYNQLYSASQQ